MFLVNYPCEKRIEKIKGFLGNDEDAPIAILLAAVQFEWVVSRAIMILGNTPTADLRKVVNRTSGLDYYVDLWRDEISEPLEQLRLTEVVKNWGGFRESFKARHRIVHGMMSANKSYALKHVHLMLNASEDVRKFVESLEQDLHSRLKTRQRPRKK
jgi:hypothetical protein